MIQGVCVAFALNEPKMSCTLLCTLGVSSRDDLLLRIETRVAFKDGVFELGCILPDVVEIRQLTLY